MRIRFENIRYWISEPKWDRLRVVYFYAFVSICAPTWLSPFGRILSNTSCVCPFSRNWWVYFKCSCIQNGAGIAYSTRLQVDNHGFVFRQGLRIFLFSKTFQTCSEAHSAYHSAGTGALPGVIKRTKRDFERSPSPIVQFKNEWSHDYFPHTLSWRVRGQLYIWKTASDLLVSYTIKTIQWCKGKGKVIPLQAWCGPEGG